MKNDIENLVGVTGMPLAGKTTVAEIIREQGYQMIDMGDVVREETSKRNVPTSEIGEWVTKIREKKGDGIIAKYTLEKMKKLEEDPSDIVVTGMRNWEEKLTFEDTLEEKMNLVAVWAPTDTRKARRNSRKRKEDKIGDGFKAREKREIRNGVGELIARSDYMIKNNGDNISATREKTLNILEEIEND